MLILVTSRMKPHLFRADDVKITTKRVTLRERLIFFH